jgi:hypothetical protein
MTLPEGTRLGHCEIVAELGKVRRAAVAAVAYCPQPISSTRMSKKTAAEIERHARRTAHHHDASVFDQRPLTASYHAPRLKNPHT